MHPRHIRLRNFFSSSTLELRHNKRFPLPRRKDMGTPKKKASAVAVMVLVRNDGRVWKLLDSKRVFVFFCENKISTLTIKAVNHGEEVFCCCCLQHNSQENERKTWQLSHPQRRRRRHTDKEQKTFCLYLNKDFPCQPKLPNVLTLSCESFAEKVVCWRKVRWKIQ